MIPALAHEGLADAVDAFCEDIAFSPDQVARVFEAAQTHGLRVKLHADQLSNLHGAALAARFGALSADHLSTQTKTASRPWRMRVSPPCFCPAPSISCGNQTSAHRRLAPHGVPIAIATDCNPGTSPLTSLLLTMNMGATLFRLTVEECLAGVTRAAARALGRGHDIGTLEAGKYCDLAIWNIERPAELVYRMGFNPLHARVWRGE